MKILYVCGHDLDQPTCGCAQRSRFLYDALNEIGDVDVFKLSPRQVHESCIAKVFRKLTKVARWPFGSLSVDLCLKPATEYDAVVCRYLSAAALTQAWKVAPCFVDVDDMPSEAFEKVDGKRLPPILRPLGAVLVGLYQRYCLRKCSGAWAVSDAQAETLTNTGLRRVAVLPNLAREPESAYDVDAAQERLLMTVGQMGYSPNQEGVGWFVRNVWPEVHKRWPDLRYAVAGGGMPEELKRVISSVPGVRLLGFVPNLDSLYAKSLAVVAPILSGAGTCIKVVEAGLHGRFLFATPMALRGLARIEKLGGVARFEDELDFCREFEAFLNSDHKCLQHRILYETKKLNSVLAFREAVKELL